MKLDEIPLAPENYPHRMDGYLVSHRLVKTRIFGDRTVHAYVTLCKSGSRRLFFSTVAPMALHMSIVWQESKTLRDTSHKLMTFYPLKLYKLRWGIETNYYEQKMFWKLAATKFARDLRLSPAEPDERWARSHEDPCRTRTRS